MNPWYTEWDDLDPLFFPNLIRRIALLRAAHRALHTEISVRAANPNSTPPEIFRLRFADETLENFSKFQSRCAFQNAILTGSAEDLFELLIRPPSPEPLVSAYFSSMPTLSENALLEELEGCPFSNQKILRFDRYWELSLVRLALHCGWKFGEVEATVSLKGVETFQRALETRLWNEGVLLFCEASLDHPFEETPEGHWTGHWRFILSPNFRHPDKIFPLPPFLGRFDSVRILRSQVN